MLRALKELFARADNHMNLLDDLNETASKIFRAIRKNYGY
jgi:hypothetical protein